MATTAVASAERRGARTPIASIAGRASKAQHALQAAALGIPVFRLRRNGKKPAAKGWQREATTDPATIERLWTETPDANIGWMTGNGLFALDIDVKQDRHGDQSLGSLQIDHGFLPTTLKNSTPTGGWHLLFKTDRPVINHGTGKKLGRGIDVRGEGGYVVGAGSTIDGAAYQSALTPIADAPAWLVTMTDRPIDKQNDQPVAELDTGAAIARATEYLQSQAPAAVEGQGGDHTTFTVAARLRDLAISAPQALELMLEHWNPLCSPPWDPDDLERKVANAFQYASRAPGNAAAEADFQIVSMAPAAVLPIVGFDDIDADLNDYSLVDGILDGGALSVLYGEPNAGKSALALSLAYHIAAGKPWAGRDVEQGTVVYFALEGSRGANNRIAALKRAAGDQKRVPLFLSAGPLFLLNRASLQKARDTLAWIKDTTGKPVTWVVVDTLPRAMAGGDENTGKDMGLSIAALDLIRQETGAAVCAIHHSGKNTEKGARGHSSLRGAVDQEILVTERNGQHFVSVTKMRDGAKGVKIPFAIKGFPLGTSSRGKQVTAALVEVAGHSAVSAEAEFETSALTGRPAGMLQALEGLEAFRNEPGAWTPFAEIQRACATLEGWPQNAEALRQACKRSRADLVDAGRIELGARGAVRSVPGTGTKGTKGTKRDI